MTLRPRQQKYNSNSLDTLYAYRTEKNPVNRKVFKPWGLLLFSLSRDVGHQWVPPGIDPPIVSASRQVYSTDRKGATK